MAIVEMKRISLLAMKADQKKILKSLQRMGCVQVTDPPADAEEFRAQNSREAERAKFGADRLKWAIGKLKRYDTEKAPSFGIRKEISEQDADQLITDEKAIMLLVDKLEEDERRTGEMRGTETRIHAQIEQLTPWLALDVPISELRSTKYVRQYVGLVPQNAMPALQDAFAGESAVLQPLNDVREGACVYAAVYRDSEEKIAEALKTANFTPMQFGDITGTVKDKIQELQQQLSSLDSERAEMEQKHAEIGKSIPQMKALYDLKSIEAERGDVVNRFAETGCAFYLHGWVPANDAQRVQDKLHKVSPSCVVECVDPDKDDEPPVQLKNGRLASPFESIVQGFALPMPNSVDPTAVMAPFYACFFGMMVSDAGYGLLMAILIPLFIKWKHIKAKDAKLLWVIAIGGVSTVIWGLIYNTVFGFNPLKVTVLDAMNDSITVMMVCVGLGAVHLFAGLGMGAYLNFKRGKPLDALYDQFSWIILIIGIALYALLPTSKIGMIMAIFGVVVILFSAGREKSKNPIKRLISGLGALYGITSWLSDLLSYMRLFGMGLTTGVIGMVINMLVGMVMGNGIFGIIIGSVIFVGAHIFNLAINTLGAYVHACRLQYIEFFGKFYEEGGKPFKPLCESTRYIAVQETANE